MNNIHIIRIYQRKSGSIMVVSQEGDSYWIPIYKKLKRDKNNISLDPAFSGKPTAVIDMLLRHFGFKLIIELKNNH